MKLGDEIKFDPQAVAPDQGPRSFGGIIGSPFTEKMSMGEYALARVDDLFNFARRVSRSYLFGNVGI